MGGRGRRRVDYGVRGLGDLHAPDVSANTVVEVSLTVTAGGTGINARTGTSDTETDTERFTVIPAGTDPPPLPDAEAPNVTIEAVASVEDDATLTLSATVSAARTTTR